MKEYVGVVLAVACGLLVLYLSRSRRPSHWRPSEPSFLDFPAISEYDLVEEVKRLCDQINSDEELLAVSPLRLSRSITASIANSHSLKAGEYVETACIAAFSELGFEVRVCSREYDSKTDESLLYLEPRRIITSRQVEILPPTIHVPDQLLEPPPQQLPETESSDYIN